MDRNDIKRKLERTLSQNKIIIPPSEESKPFTSPPPPPPPPPLQETKKEETPSANTDVDNEAVPTLSKIYPNAEKRDRKLTNQSIKVSGLDGNKVDALTGDETQADNNRTIIYLLSCFNCFNR
jgi:hypothetical protein